ncbi:MAG: SulP family inorganic anion transporter, partial [Pirellulales bacterium]|nr:SulP family inorganic anion transporter [Pirellulales bacterium]
AGCPLQVSGPAAGLTVIVFELIQRLGLEMLGLAVLVGGMIQLAAGGLRLGQWFRAVSPAVIHGMLAGIGILIFASQFHVMVDDKPRGSGLQNLATIPQAIWKGLGVPHLSDKADRKFRSRALQELGEVHRQQINLRAHIAELIPYHHVAPQAPTLEAIVEPHLDDWTPVQEKLSGELERISDELAAVQRQGANAASLERAAAALAEALQRSRRAERALDSGKAIDAVRTQEAAVAALDQAASRLKNHRIAAGLGLLTIAIIILWQRFAPRRLRLAPAPLLAIAATTAIAAALALPVLYVEVPERLWDEIRWPTWSLLEQAPWGQLLASGLLIAIVASAETLLCATAVDQLAKGCRTNYDRELAAQGAGNVVCGLLGALPMTGVIVRSSANVQAGAKSRLSAVLHGVWLLVFVAALAGVLQLIPTASLAAVLVYTGYKLINFKQIKKLARAGRGELAIYLATVVTIVVEDLLIGVMTGVALAAAKLLYTFSHLAISIEHNAGEDRYVMRLGGSATFIRLPRLAAALEQMPGDAELHVQLDRLNYIDHACLELLTNWAQQHEASGGRLVIDWDSLHASFREGPEAAVRGEAGESPWIARREPARAG